MPDTDVKPSADAILPSPALNIGSTLEAASYFKSPYFTDSYYFPYNPDPNCRGNNYKIYDEMRDDDQVKVALSFKKDIVVNSGWQLECADPMVKAFVEDSLKRMQESGSLQMSFEDAVRDMLSAYDYGFSVTEPVFRIQDGFYEFESLRVRPPQSFTFIVGNKGDVVEISQSTADGEKNYDPRLFLHHVYQTEFGNPYGKSDLRGAHACWKAKKFVTKFLAIYLERFASPTVIGKYPSSWDSDEIGALTATLRSIQQATTLTLPESAMVEFVQANKDSSDVYITALNYYNMHIARSLLVPDLLGISGEKTSGGSFALGQDQFKMFLATIDKDRTSLARKITLRLIAPLVRANFGPGIECEFKFVNYSMDDQVELLKVWADVVKGKVFEPTPEEVNYLRRQLKFPEGPVIIPQQPMAPIPGMPMPGMAPAPVTDTVLPEPAAEQHPEPAPQPEEMLPDAMPFKLKRALTQAEKKVDFKLIQESLDKAESELSRRLKRAGRMVWADYLSQVRDSGLINRFNPARLTELQPRKLKEFNGVLRGSLMDLLEQAHDEARRELFPDKKFALDDGELTIDDMMEVLDAEAFNVAKDYAGLVSKKVNQSIVQGLKQGMSQSEILAKLREELPDATDTWLDTLVRTKTTEVYNRGRKSYFDNDPLAQQVIAAYQFSAIIDARTSDVCAELDGKIFDADDANINLLTPPLHFNCRSVIVPVTRFEKEALSEVEKVPGLDKLQDMGAGLL